MTWTLTLIFYALLKKVLLTSVCRPLGPRQGDAPSVGYELLFGQVTRAQGLFSPRSHHVHFSLEYIAENLEAPTTVLQYPSKEELVRELERGYDVIGVSFLLATLHRMKEVVALIRKHSPRSQIVLGGYGTVLSDEALRPFGDHICREEGVAFLRRLLGEPEIKMPYRHPMVVNPLRVFGLPVSRTGVVFAGLGCPSGCDFCCTSHFFKRKHIQLLPTGADIYQVIERYLEIDPRMAIIIIDEDFLLNRRRALEFRDCVVRGGKALSIFAFASIRAISQYAVTEILEMGIDGLWIGYEGTRSGFPKQSGRPAAEVLTEFREHGINVLASMIVGFPYQTPEIIEEELSGLLALRPGLTQFLIYGPVPGTPFHERVVREGLLDPTAVTDPDSFYRRGDGFSSLVKHPTMSPAEIEAAQRRCFEEDFQRLGPSIYRSVDSWLLGHLKLRESPLSHLRRKAARFTTEIRKAYPVFLAGKLLGPNAEVRRWIADLEARVHATLGPPTLLERCKSVAALVMALWTALILKLHLFQHPRLIRHTFRLQEDSGLARAWRRLRGEHPAGHRVDVERRPPATVWIRVEGTLAGTGAGKLVADLRRALERKKDQVVLDLARLAELKEGAAERISEGLRAYRDRIRVVLPKVGEIAALATFFGLYR
ncbi:MAG: cobalamin B12-binding domain-containing protein [Planctomycetes bacterium]|nr:cobalamin B12-binding domain-containing protein [Planctomycetota bacterium]